MDNYGTDLVLRFKYIVSSETEFKIYTYSPRTYSKTVKPSKCLWAKLCRETKQPTMLLVLACPIVLVLPKEKPVLCVVVAWPKGLKRLAACGCAAWPNRPPVAVPNPPAAAARETNTQHVASFTPVSTYCCFCLFLFCHHVRAAPKVLLVCPKEKLLLGAAAPNRPVAVLDVAGADPNKLPVAAAIGLVGPFLPAW